jgi:hypothetical protein
MHVDLSKVDRGHLVARAIDGRFVGTVVMKKIRKAEEELKAALVEQAKKDAEDAARAA